MTSVEPAYRPATDEHRTAVETARAALLDPAMEHIVEMIVRPVGDAYEAASVDGAVQFSREAEGNGWRFRIDEVEGRDPLANQATDRFSPLAEEQATAYPDRTENAYPNAYEQIVQLFDAPASPDLVAIHTAAHNWADQGGHIGEHGSIDVVQARAPFVMAGAGVRQAGLLPQACKLVDIAPTVLALMGAPTIEGTALNGSGRADALLARQDGEVQHDMLDASASPPEFVVGFLLDGANANVLYDLAARGEAPNVARLLAMGTAMGQGAMSSLPTVTLANHTAILTGAHPGHHGILHNAWYDRVRQEQVITNSPAHWITSMTHLDPSVETMFQAVHHAFPGALAISVNEPCDVGADHSVFDVMRRGEMIDGPPPADELPFSTERFVRPVKEYRTSSRIDHTAVDQFRGIWGGSYRGTSWPTPKFTWVNFTLTDAAFHEGGPYSEIALASVHDTDARIGVILQSIEQAGVFDRTAFFLTADHGMEESNLECTGNWADALDDSGVPYRDEGYSFIYVNP